MNKIMQYVEEKIEPILRHGEKIGRMMLFLVYNKDCTAYDYAYVYDFEIYYEGNRHKGYGTHALLETVYQYGRVYVFPSNPNSEKLYARLGKQITIEDCPDALKTAYKECGTGYLISIGGKE